MTTAIQPQNIALTFGDRTDIKDLSARIKIMVPGGAKLTDPETMALAQVSLVCGLNPFLGEVWYIPGKGPTVGIRGARRYAQQQVVKEGGHGSYYWIDTQPCPPEEAGASPANVEAAFRSTLYDSMSTNSYLTMFTHTVEQLRAAGSKDPVGDTKEMIGPKPCWVGYGFSTKEEQTRMNKTQVARKRAESDALKKRFDIPFGAEVSEFDTSGEADVITGTAVTVQDGDDGLLDQLAEQESENVSQETGEVVPPVELIDPSGEWAVKHAAAKWNVSTSAAAKAIASKKLGKRIDKADFIALVEEG